jgi:hypothetical protein
MKDMPPAALGSPKLIPGKKPGRFGGSPVESLGGVAYSWSCFELLLERFIKFIDSSRYH